MIQTRIESFRRFVPVMLVVAVLACGGGGYDSPTTPPPSGNNPPGGNPPPGGGASPGLTASVAVSDNSFTPATVTIAKTGTVTWTWAGGGYGESHNVTFNNANMTGSGDMADGSFSKTFPDVGTFGYQCTRHSGMSGSVVVK